MAQMTLRGVTVWYDRDGSELGTYRTPYPAKAQDQRSLLDAISGWLDDMRDAGLPIRKIATAGTYTGKRGAHGQGLAVDIDSVLFTDGRNMIARDSWKQPTELYIRTWAGLMRWFSIVLSGHYNAAHHDHLHCDLTGKSIFGGDASVGQFIQAGLRWAGFDPGAIDGVIGAKTQAAFGQWWVWAKSEGLVSAAAPPTTRAAMADSLSLVTLYGRRPGSVPKPVQEAVVTWEGVGRVPYTMIGEQAYVPLRQVAEGLGFEVDVSEYPRIGVSPPT